MEYFDIVDEFGVPTGETISRKEAHQKGIRHRTAHIWVVNDNDVLFQQRSFTKDSFPGLFDTSSAGHIQAGDEPLESALRELEEELGIKAQPEDLTFIGNFKIQYEKTFYDEPFKDNEIVFAYLYNKPIDIKDITIQKEELEKVEWFNLDDAYHKRVTNDPMFCVPKEGLELLYSYLKRVD